jgi:hypothetical protein
MTYARRRRRCGRAARPARSGRPRAARRRGPPGGQRCRSPSWRPPRPGDLVEHLPQPGPPVRCHGRDAPPAFPHRQRGHHQLHRALGETRPPVGPDAQRGQPSASSSPAGAAPRADSGRAPCTTAAPPGPRRPRLGRAAQSRCTSSCMSVTSAPAQAPLEHGHGRCALVLGCSKAMLAGPSSTSAVTSSPRCAGRSCRKRAPGGGRGTPVDRVRAKTVRPVRVRLAVPVVCHRVCTRRRIPPPFVDACARCPWSRAPSPPARLGQHVRLQAVAGRGAQCSSVRVAGQARASAAAVLLPSPTYSTRRAGDGANRRSSVVRSAAPGWGARRRSSR